MQERSPDHPILSAMAKPGGLFNDTAVSHLPWRGQHRRVRMVVSRRSMGGGLVRGQAPAAYLANICSRLTGALRDAGVTAHRMDERAIRYWLVQWFNPCPDHLGTSAKNQRRFFEVVNSAFDQDGLLAEGTLPFLASGTDFSQCLMYREPRSDAQKGL